MSDRVADPFAFGPGFTPDTAVATVPMGSARVRRRQDVDEPLALSVEEAARLLGISRTLAYESVARGELPAVRLGRRIVVPRRALELLLAPPDIADTA